MKVPALVSIAIAGSAMTLGCYGPSGNDAAVYCCNDESLGRPEPVSRTYIVAAFVIPDAPTGPMMNITPGFNLDGKVSDGTAMNDCEDLDLDFVSPRRETGVDNQLVGSLLGQLTSVFTDLDVQATVDARVASGSFLLAMRVNDINSYENDSSVTLDLFLVDPAGCDASPCAPMGGTVSAGAMWRMQAGPALATGLSATIEDSELSGGPLDLPLTLDVRGTTIDLTMRDARIGGHITATDLTDGGIGGALRVEDLVSSFEAIEPGLGETVRDLIAASADLTPSAADAQVCESVSAGIGFTAVEGTIE